MTPEGLPDPLGVFVVTIGNMLIRELGVEVLLRWKRGLLETLPGVHVLIGVHTFAHQQRALVLVRLILGCDKEGLGFVCGYQLVEVRLQELGAIDEAQLPQGEADVLLGVVGDAAHPLLHLEDGLHQQVAVVPPQVVEDHRYGCGLWAEPQFEVAGAVGGSSVLAGDVAVVPYRVTPERLVTHMASARSPVALPVCTCHSHGLGVRQHFLDPTLFLLESLGELFCCVGPPVFDRRLCLPVAPHLDIAVTACEVVLCPPGVTFLGVELGSLDFRGEGFEVGVDNVWRRQLLVVVLESELALGRHLHPCSRLADSLALRPMSFQQVFPGIAMETALAEVLLLSVFALVIEEAVEVLDPGVVELTRFLNQQQIEPGLLFWLLAYVVYDHPLVPAEYVDGKVVLALHLADLRDGCGGIDAGEV